MLILINTVAASVVFIASIWALLTPRLPIRTGGSILLMALAFGFFGVIVSPHACHSEPEVLANLACAGVAMGLFWRVEARRWFYRNGGQHEHS